MSLISLNEAITALMGDNLRTPEEECKIYEDAQADMGSAAKCCHEYFSALDDGAQALSKLVDGQLYFSSTLSAWPIGLQWPPNLVVETLGGQPKSNWPSPVSELFKRAKKYADFFADYSMKYSQALAFILAESRSGRIQLFGRRYANALPVPISSDELADPLEIDASRKNLVSNLRTSIVYEVQLESDQLPIAIGRMLRERPFSARPSDDAIAAWITAHKAVFEHLNDSAQEKMLREQFPGIKDARGRLRAYRKANPRPRGRGRKKPRV